MSTFDIIYFSIGIICGIIGFILLVKNCFCENGHCFFIQCMDVFISFFCSIIITFLWPLVLFILILTLLVRFFYKHPKH